MFHAPERYRVTRGTLATDTSFGNNGFFIVPLDNEGTTFAYCIVSDGGVTEHSQRWEHVSVHIREDDVTETPTWAEMCIIKNTFWDKEDCVLQYHPSESDYVNMHPNVLHLWRPVGVIFPVPDTIMVGLK